MPLSDEYRWGGGATEEEKKSSECTLKEKLVSHSVSTGFLRTMSAAEVSLSTGLVSLIGWGEAGLEPGAWHWGPGRNREKKRGGGRQKTRWLKTKAVKQVFPQYWHCRHLQDTSGKSFSIDSERFHVFVFLITCGFWPVPVQRVWVAYRSEPSPHFLLIPLLRHKRRNTFQKRNDSLPKVKPRPKGWRSGTRPDAASVNITTPKPTINNNSWPFQIPGWPSVGGRLSPVSLPCGGACSPVWGPAAYAQLCPPFVCLSQRPMPP